MPQNPLNAPDSNRPQTPSESQPAIAQLSQRVEAIWQKVQPLLITQSIKALTASARGLQWGLDRLESIPTSDPSRRSDAASSPAGQPSQAGRNGRRAAWQTAGPVLKTQGIRILRVLQEAAEWGLYRLQTAASAPPAGARSAPPASQTAIALDRLAAALQQGWNAWVRLVNHLRDRLPSPWRQTLSPSVVTGVLVVLLLVLTWSKPGPAPAQSPRPGQELPGADTQLVPGPANAEAPAVASPDALFAPPLEPETPPLELTPEQDLIAAIQDQVAALTSQYADGLIQSVQANFRNSCLTVKISEGWYALSETRQDQLANEMLVRATDLDFSSLELLDPQGEVLARSPVVGSTMVVLKRGAAGPDLAN